MPSMCCMPSRRLQRLDVPLLLRKDAQMMDCEILSRHSIRIRLQYCVTATWTP